jgi:aminoglycoside phosphotransferase family enzyme/predicted kinase
MVSVSMTQEVSDMRATKTTDDLLRPEAFAGVVATSRVSLVETHISWVFLLDRDVFKVKKPVDLGFLNFSSPERRLQACQDEVRLNARLAPGVYRGVVRITRETDGRCVVEGSGQVVDWAVHMERLKDEERADTLLAQGALSTDRIDAVAARIAEFHAAACADDRVSRYGQPSVIAKNIQENFDQTQHTLSRYLSPREAEEIVRWQTGFVCDEQKRFENRIAQGRVRDGHGDLRLEHVHFTPGGAIVVLDCIEFNERFRYADACADIAFLSMDLAAHGRVDLAERLLGSYAREADDFDLYTVVDFYEGYRAFVRGKVASMIAGDETADPGSRQRAAQEARRYFLLALSSDRQSLLRPSVVAVGGMIASGKSAIASHLSDELSAPIVEADRTRKAMLRVDPLRPLDDPAWSGAYDPAFSDRVYRELFRRAGVILDSGRPVVLDASFRSASLRRTARDLAKDRSVPFRFVECRVAPELCRQRLAAREHQRTVSDGRLAIFDEFCSRYEAVTELAADEHLVLDTARSIKDSLEALRGSLGTWPGGLVG